MEIKVVSQRRENAITPRPQHYLKTIGIKNKQTHRQISCIEHKASSSSIYQVGC
ncbi:UNVERIFIED_CONTAM: hypothetical protein FKN15_020241 [Acipenser sinensis]